MKWSPNLKDSVGDTGGGGGTAAGDSALLLLLYDHLADWGASQHRVYYTAYLLTKPINKTQMSYRELGKLTQWVLIRTIIICEAFHIDVRLTHHGTWASEICTKVTKTVIALTK